MMPGKMLLIIFSFTLILIGSIYLFFKLSEKKKRRKVGLVNKKEEFSQIKDFSMDDYIEDAFRRVFHSVQVDDWEMEVRGDEIEFERGDSYIDKVSLKVKYEIKSRRFKISAIYLSAGEFFTYTGDIRDDDYRFFYKCYSDYKIGRNKEKKESADKSLERINRIVGKASIRDSKIDDILGSN